MAFNWKEYLPEEIAKKLEGKDNIVRIAANSFWLLSDKILRIIVALFVTGWLARYLGVDGFGKLNNAIAFATLFGAFASLGLDSIVIRELVKFPEEKETLLGTAFYLKLIAGFITYLLSAICVILLRPSEGEWINRVLVYIISAGVLFQSFDVIDFYFQSQVKSKYTVFAKNAAFILISLVKISFIVLHKPLIWFGWATLGEMILNAVALILIFQKRKNHISRWSFNNEFAKMIFRQGSAIFIAYVAAYTYMKVDQIMISKYIGDAQAGLFAASAKLYEFCFFIIIVLVPSFYPSLIHVFEKDKRLFYKRYSQVTAFFSVLGYSALAFILLFGNFVVTKLYGDQYAIAATVLKIQIFGMLFMFNGGLRSSYLAIIHRQDIIMITSIVAALFNILFNLYAIPRYGIIGSAWATVLTSFLAVFFSNVFFKDTSVIFKLQLKNLLMPWLAIGRGKKNEL